MYADTLTDSMEKAIRETNRRRDIQDRYNKENGIVPVTIKKDIRAVIEATKKAQTPKTGKKERRDDGWLETEILRLTEEMNKAAKALDFEKAAELRDKIKAYQS